MHELRYLVEKENCNKDAVLTKASKIADKHGDYEGQVHSIRWIDRTICDNEDAAREYIRNNDKGWYDNLAVRFYDYSAVNAKKPKKIETLEERVATQRKRLYEIESVPYAKTLTSTEYVGCKHCGSKIATKYLRGNHCPVCGADMRPKTTLDRIESTKARIAETEKELNAEMLTWQKKQRDKAQIKWLVKIEYHC